MLGSHIDLLVTAQKQLLLAVQTIDGHLHVQEEGLDIVLDTELVLPTAISNSEDNNLPLLELLGNSPVNNQVVDI